MAEIAELIALDSTNDRARPRFAAAWDMAIAGRIPAEVQPGEGHAGHTQRHAQGHTAHAQGHAQDHVGGGISPQFAAAMRRAVASEVGSHEGEGHTRGHTNAPGGPGENSPPRPACPKPGAA
ncbi:hypothetical protein [Sphingomonas sp.]|uniref:hypothetical protein n=1 Tax=Sphingomonas sp. TaxID=28214 RepID=UPI0037535174